MPEIPWLDAEQNLAWVRTAAVLELLPSALDSQLQRDAGLTHFDYLVIMMLSDAPEQTLRMTELALRTNSTLPRLSHVASRLEGKGYLQRFPCPEDRRATNARLTKEGAAKLEETAPGHLALVRSAVIDALSPEQLRQLSDIAATLLTSLDPEGKMSSVSCRTTAEAQLL